MGFRTHFGDKSWDFLLYLMYSIRDVGLTILFPIETEIIFDFETVIRNRNSRSLESKLLLGTNSKSFLNHFPNAII